MQWIGAGRQGYVEVDAELKVDISCFNTLSLPRDSHPELMDAA